METLQLADEKGAILKEECPIEYVLACKEKTVANEHCKSTNQC